MEQKLLKIINHYGVNHQLRKFNEEAFELIEAIINGELNRFIGISRKPSELAIKHITEEIADVMVMLKQFQCYYKINREEVRKIMNEKIDRQLDRMKEEK